MITSNNNVKALNQIIKILEFIKNQYQLNPRKEAITCPFGALASFDSSLDDSTLVQKTIEQIVQDSQKNVQIENRLGSAYQLATENQVAREALLWIYVVDINKLNDYEISVRLKMDKLNKTVHFILDDQGYFYPENTEPKKRHRFKTNSDRYQLLYLLAKQKKFISTKELVTQLTLDNEKIRKRVGEIKDIIVNKWGLPRESLFESDGVSGYRTLNVELK